MTTDYWQGIDYMTAKGFLKDEERKLLFELASKVKPGGIIVNIGIEYGASLACLCAGSPWSYIIGFDIDCSKVLEKGYGAQVIEKSSHEAVKTWASPIELIFVDGDHGKAGVLLDAKFADFLTVGGHILFQDCWDWNDPTKVHPLCDGVNAAVVEWYDLHRGEFTELPSVGTTRIFKRVS